MSRKAENRKDFTQMVFDGPEGQRLWHHLRSLVAGGSNSSKMKASESESMVVEVDEVACTATAAQVEAFRAKPDPSWGSILDSMMPRLDPAARRRLSGDQVRALVVLAVREAMAELDYPEEEQRDLVLRYLGREYHSRRDTQRKDRRPSRPDANDVVVVTRPRRAPQT